MEPEPGNEAGCTPVVTHLRGDRDAPEEETKEENGEHLLRYAEHGCV